MKEGGIKKRVGCTAVICIWFIASLIPVIINSVFVSEVNSLGINKSVLLVLTQSCVFIFTVTMIFIYWIYLKKKNSKVNAGIMKEQRIKIKEDSVIYFTLKKGRLILNNPFRGIFVVGSAGSGKSESIAVPLLQQFTDRRFSGVVYDFKFPTLANDVESFLKDKGSDIKHFFLDFNNPLRSYRVNPLNPVYLPNTSYAREYAQAIISNLMKESIKKPDFWTRSATDLLTACIWYLREEHPEMCDLPHVFAMITSNDEALLKTLQKNPQTAQMTISIFNAMERGADSQVSGVIGTLQGAIAQINTPELMYIFSGDDFSLNVNDPANPIVLTVGSYPTLTSTFAPLCSLVITVATKLMNQPDKHPSFVLLDEAPTCFIPNIEVLPNTGRSNKIATVFMCQDLAQVRDGYGKEKADVLFASCNNHFYGRIGSSVTADILSKQFGKYDKVYTTKSKGGQGIKRFIMPNKNESETIQEREIIRPSEFLQLNVGEFAGVTVESNKSHFKEYFNQVSRRQVKTLEFRTSDISIMDIYVSVRSDINHILNRKDYLSDKKDKMEGYNIFENVKL